MNFRRAFSPEIISLGAPVSLYLFLGGTLVIMELAPELLFLSIIRHHSLDWS